MQIPFSILVNQTHKRKRYMLTIGLTARAVWILAGLIPVFVPMDPAFLQLWSLIFLIGVSSLGAAMIQVCWFPWFSDLAPLRIRGRWLSVKDMISAAAHVVFGIIVAQLLDTLPPESRTTKTGKPKRCGLPRRLSIFAAAALSEVFLGL